jgi:hypothetical protein
MARSYFLSLLTSLSGRVKDELVEMHTLLNSESIDELGEKYLQLCSAFSSLPLQKQDLFAPAMNELRMRIEDQILAEKEIEEFLPRASKGSIKQRHTYYEKINKAYKVLPHKVQREYYHHIVHLRHELEGGR